MNYQYKTISSVESFTGGLFASTIVSKPGASKYFKGALITYNNEIKEKLGIDTSKGVINSHVAIEMAMKGKKFFNADYCISFTGNAGPSTMEKNKMVGELYIAINETVFELKIDSKKTRNEIRQIAVDFAIKKINKIINENNKEIKNE